MDIRTTLHRSAAALLVAGAATGTTMLATGVANAAPQSPLCSPAQVSTTLVGGDAGMSNRHAAIQFTANPGETCTLPGAMEINLVGADNVLIDSDAAPNSAPVEITDGGSAYVPLHWTSAGSPDEQQTPLAVTFSPDRSTGADNQMSLSWNLDPVDAFPGSHTIDTGATTPGPAPTV